MEHAQLWYDKEQMYMYNLHNGYKTNRRNRYKIGV